MNERAYWYAFFSSIFTRTLDEKTIIALTQDTELLGILKITKALDIDELNIDFTTTFIVNSPPIESYVRTLKDNAPTGLDNEAVAFYAKHGFDFYLNKSELNVPDHLAIGLGFMQALCLKEGTTQIQKLFLEERILPWVVPYLVGVKENLETEFYIQVCDTLLEYLLVHYEELCNDI